MAKDRSAEVKAGIVVLVGIAILLGGLFWVSGGADQFADKAFYTIHFENGGGIGDGDNVYLAGQRTGSVDSISTAEAERDGVRKPFVAVRVKVDKDARIYEDSVFRIEKTITNVVTLHVEYGDESKVLATSKSKLFGERLSTFEETIHTAQGLLLSAQEGMMEFRALIADARAQVGHLGIDRLQARAEEILAKIDRAAAEAEGILTDARQPIDETLGKANRAAGHVEELTGTVKKDWSESLEPRVETVLDNAAGAAGEAKAILQENRERFKSILQQADDVMRRVGPVMDTIERLGRDLDETVVEIRPGLVRTIDRAKKAMENFAATTEDLKTAPWKLVNKPSDKESDIIHLYNSSRLYVEAASQIQDNIQDLETLRRLGVLEDAEKGDLVARATSRLEEALKDFETRQKRFYEAIVAFSGK